MGTSSDDMAGVRPLVMTALLLIAQAHAVNVRIAINGDDGHGILVPLPSAAASVQQLVQALTSPLAPGSPPGAYERGGSNPFFVSERAIVFAANRGNLNASAMVAVLREGERLYVVPDNQQFMHPTLSLGEARELAVNGANGEPIMVTSLARSPRVLHIRNLISEEEMDHLREAAAPELQRSTMGLRENQNTNGEEIAPLKDNTRTSLNAWISGNPEQTELQKRCFRALATQTKVGEYDNRYADGFQVLRYQKAQLYNTHMDYFATKPTSSFNFVTANGGSNRYATVFIYLSTPELGGQTYFHKATHSRPAHYQLTPAVPVSNHTLTQALDNSTTMAADTWQRRLAEQCFNGKGLSVYPRRGDAVVFYSQNPDLSEDKMSEHAGCPVLQGEKWAANLWLWNKPKQGESQADKPPDPLVKMSLQFTAAEGIECLVYWVKHADLDAGLARIFKKTGVIRSTTEFVTQTFHSHIFEFYVHAQGNQSKTDGQGAGFVGSVVADLRLGEKQQWECGLSGLHQVVEDEQTAETAETTAPEPSPMGRLQQHQEQQEQSESAETGSRGEL